MVITDKEHAKVLVDRFVSRFSESYRYLLYHAALPLVLTPELLHYIRNSFLRGQVDWIAEVDLLLSDLCHKVGYELYAIDTSVRAYCLDEMNKEEMRKRFGQKRMQEVASLLIKYLKSLSQNNSISNQELRSQKWAALVYLDNEHKREVANEIAAAFINYIKPSTTNAEPTLSAINQHELYQLSLITKELAPQLDIYPEIIKFAEETYNILSSSSKTANTKLTAINQLLAINPNIINDSTVDLQNMKITILGTSGAGKTAYMLGMFSDMQTGLGGFTVTTDHDTENILRNQWDALVMGGENRWPPGTPSSTLYRFTFNYSYNPVMQFDWLDYRGGAMMQSSSEDDVHILLQHLQESDCIFLCIPGELLEANQTNDTHQVITRSQTAKMNGFLRIVGERLKPTIKKPFPIVLIITKADLVSNTTFPVISNLISRSPLNHINGTQQSKLTNLTMKLFPTLFAPDSGWLTMICPVTLGKGLAKDKKEGKIDPVNLSLPLIFAIQSKFLKIKRSLSEIQKEQEFKNYSSKETRPLNLDSTTVKTDPISSTKLAEIERYMDLLKPHLSECPIFLGGRDK